MSRKTIFSIRIPAPAAILIALIAGLSVTATLPAQETNGVSPTGANTAPDLFSPATSLGGFTTSTGGAPASALNPAAGGQAQRPVFDLQYLALPGLGDEEGFGHAASLGILIPTRVGVFGGGLRFLNSPFDDAFPVGTSFDLNLNAAKEIYPGMSVGLGLNAGVNDGSDDEDYDWTVSGDLGFRYNLGKLGPLENFTWAAALRGMGKTRSPSMFTPAGGVSFDFFHIPSGVAGGVEPFRLTAAADLLFPTVQNAGAKLGLKAVIGEMVTITAASTFNIRESLDGNGPSPIPSVGLGVSFKLKSGGSRIVGGMLPSDGEVAGALLARPLYGDVWAMGAGVTWTAGVVDRRPPVITVDYDDSAWISPNNDGKADALEFPVTITDERYIAEWVMEIRDERDEVVRTYRNKEKRAETQGFKNFFQQLTEVKSGVEVPAAMRWDGVLDSGAVAPDGAYTFVISAADDNGNRSATAAYKVWVDNTPPEVEVADLTPGMNIFSPDGDGSQDTLAISQTGTEEERWDVGFYDAAGVKVRTLDLTNAAPADLVWDGRNDKGEIVKDGVYSYRVTATDRALNSAEAGLGSIIISTIHPPIGIAIDDAWFSPNGDKVKDTMGFSLDVPDKDGIVGWTLAIEDTVEKTAGRTLSGAGVPPARLELDGRSDLGDPLPETSYTAAFSVRYENGWVAEETSPAFTLDVTPPRAVVTVVDGDGRPWIFSPNNDGSKDTLPLRQDGSAEELWTGEVRPASAAASSAAVRTVRFPGQLPADVAWDGLNDAGAPAPDGFYVYQLSATDQAGNRGSSDPVEFEINTKDTPVQIAADQRAFSPNGDGVKDVITLLPQVQETAGIAEWRVSIMALPSSGAPVRTLSGQGAAPGSVAWDGKTDAGETAPDGAYTARLDLRYRSGNKPQALTQAFTLDNTPPWARVQSLDTVFSPNNDGNKDELGLTQAGSSETEWVGTARRASDPAGAAPVWTVRFTGEPDSRIAWDGMSDAGSLAPDGVYVYTLTATDQAGNTGASEPARFELVTRDTPVLLAVDQRAFSPNNDGVKDTIAFQPQLQEAAGVVNWSVEVLDANRAVTQTIKGTGDVPKSIPWDGKTAQNRAAPDGVYTGRLSLEYRSGNKPTASSPTFTLDTTPPQATVTIQDTDPAPGKPPVFSPNHDGNKDSIAMNQTGSSEQAWTGEVRPRGAASGTAPVWSARFTGEPPARVEWDGVSGTGSPAPDGIYVYTLTATDQAGNTGSSKPVEFELFTRDTPLQLAVDLRAFSPNNDRVKDEIHFQPQAPETDGVTTWKLEIQSGSGAWNPAAPVTRVIEGRGAAPTSIPWDGKTTAGSVAPDGAYIARLGLVYRAGNRPLASSRSFTLDTTPPQATLSAPYTLFSPNGDGRRDTLPFTITATGTDEWRGTLTDSKNQTVRTWTWQGRPAAPIAWDGANQAGNRAPDGTYAFTMTATDEAGNTATKSLTGIQLDARTPRAFFTASAQSIAPKPGAAGDAMQFNITLNPRDLTGGVETWKLELKNETGQAVRTFSGTGSPPPASVGWSGTDDRGVLREGKYTPALTVNYAKGDQIVQTVPPVIVDVSGPVLSFASRPEYFSPDNDGVDDDLYISLGAKDLSPIAEWSLEIRETQGTRQLFYRLAGRGSPSERIVWDGRSSWGELVQAATDYSFVFAAKDNLGNASVMDGMISVDVLVIRDGDALRIQVPSITFAANAADFSDKVTAEQKASNERVLNRIALILNKFRDYKITVEGHANPVEGTQREETQELMPLSTKRAEAIVNWLASHGVARSRLNAVGRGGTRRVADPKDPDNGWKNRRVEFILIK